MPLNTDTPTVLWSLRNGHRRLECSVQLLPHGLELHLALNGDTPYLTGRELRRRMNFPH